MTKKQANEEAIKKPQSTKVETLFTRYEIMSQPSAFGVNHLVLIGAMAEMKEEKYSRNQVLEAVKSFKGRKVEQK